MCGWLRYELLTYLYNNRELFRSKTATLWPIDSIHSHLQYHSNAWNDTTLSDKSILDKIVFIAVSLAFVEYWNLELLNLANFFI